MAKAIAETSKFAANVIKSADRSASHSSAIAEEYGDRFAAFFGCSTKRAKEILRSQYALRILARIRNDFSQHFTSMSSTQIADFISHLDTKKARLAKRAFAEGISYHDMDRVFNMGTSIFDKSSNADLLKELKHTSKNISLFSGLQNGQKAAMA